MGARRRASASVRPLVISAIAMVLLSIAFSGNAIGESASETVSVTVHVQAAALDVDIRLEPADPEEGSTFRAIARITNVGTSSVSQGAASLFVDVSGLQIPGSAVRMFGSLAPGQAREVRWSVFAQEAGLYVLTVEASAIDDLGNAVHGDDSVILSVAERTRPGGRPPDAGSP